jgi:hypothetical protein
MAGYRMHQDKTVDNLSAAITYHLDLGYRISQIGSEWALMHRSSDGASVYIELHAGW